MMRPHDAEHLTSAQVAAVIDRRMRGDEHKAAIAHLSTCVDCRRDLAESQRALEAVGPASRHTPRRWTIIVAGVAAALVLAVLPVSLRSGRHDIGDSSSATRSGGVAPTDAVSPVTAIAPAEAAPLSRERELVWRSAGPNASYLVTVQDTSGTMLWSSSLTDTTATIPPTVTLRIGDRYFWSVDARLADGGSTNAGVHTFIVH